MVNDTFNGEAVEKGEIMSKSKDAQCFVCEIINFL